MKIPLLLDCTIRDGGYINGWDFSIHFARRLYRAAEESGVSAIEIGFFNPNYTGSNLWRNVRSDTSAVVRGGGPGPKLALLVNHGTVQVADLPPPSELGVEMLRFATPRGSVEHASELAAAATRLGYESTVNCMGISAYDNAAVLELVAIANSYEKKVKHWYLADSFGNLMPSRARELFEILRFGTTASLGFHPHNNLQLAFANSLEALAAGADIVDGSILGMGRGGGNLMLETALAYFERNGKGDFSLLPVLQFADLFVAPLQRKHSWGYSLPQLLSGVMGIHPSYVTDLVAAKNRTAHDVYHVLQRLDHQRATHFDAAVLKSCAADHEREVRSKATSRCSPGLDELRRRTGGRAVVVAGGPSVAAHLQDLLRLRREGSLALVSVNNPASIPEADAVFFGNRRRLAQHVDDVPSDCQLLFGSSFDLSSTQLADWLECSQASLGWIESDGVGLPPGAPANSALQALAALVEFGFKEIYIAGLDGYRSDVAAQYFFEEQDAVESEDERNRLNEETRRELVELLAAVRARGIRAGVITPTVFTEAALTDFVWPASITCSTSSL